MHALSHKSPQSGNWKRAMSWVQVADNNAPSRGPRRWWCWCGGLSMERALRSKRQSQDIDITKRRPQQAMHPHRDGPFTL
jgi:hypothetical protein